jgi:hypothetical protein
MLYLFLDDHLPLCLCYLPRFHHSSVNILTLLLFFCWSFAALGYSSHSFFIISLPEDNGFLPQFWLSRGRTIQNILMTVFARLFPVHFKVVFSIMFRTIEVLYLCNYYSAMYSPRWIIILLCILHYSCKTRKLCWLGNRHYSNRERPIYIWSVVYRLHRIIQVYKLGYYTCLTPSLNLSHFVENQEG